MPGAVPVVGATADAFPNECRGLESKSGGLVEAIGAGFDPMKAAFVEKMADDLAQGEGGVATAARGRVDDERVYAGDPTAPVVGLPADDSCAAALIVLHDEHAFVLSGGFGSREGGDERGVSSDRERTDHFRSVDELDQPRAIAVRRWPERQGLVRRSQASCGLRARMIAEAACA